ncbi:MAG: FAD binding domain-containing protein [Candidatus Krumholzibacteriota bacterium]|nr:FAD binding domain-containing protein [Candidatus Krumholzibacteriota bacterium]
MQIERYEKPRSAAEAHALLKREESAVIIGGGAFLRLSNRRIGCAIDLYEAGLDTVREEDEGLAIGAMATFRRLETDPLVRAAASGLLARCVRGVAGVPLRNLVTVGGTVAGRYGFSNLLTALLALDARVTLHEAQELPLAEYLARRRDPLDLITGVIVPRRDLRASFQCVQKTRADYALLNAAVARRGDRFRIAVGARPGPARLAGEAMAHLDAAFAAGGAGGRSRTRATEAAAVIEEAARLAAGELSFGGDVRASAWYRRQVCAPLVRRALAEVTS